ncbi:GFA family protein [Pseudorhodoferax sp.]|jgi:hypothetical protein|uniref:GFA family protein n=1 Tax=Pseudorhodoferax sp. TaxID=1993553 RepID=UPI002DD69AAC|nr:GFA family protein [Pseudorhodoferax sp.]
MAQGSCSCGAVRFEVDGALSDVYLCHCSICRRSTGANGIAVLVVANERFRWTQGEDQIARWSKPVGDWHTQFCRVCGAKLPGENDAARMFIPAGSLLDGTEALRVVHHLFVGSKAAWDLIGDTGQQHEQRIE